MSASLNSFAENSPRESGGSVWHRLHAERAEICDALLKESETGNKPLFIAPSSPEATNWHQGLLQARLSKVDDALDRLMAGSYGSCCKCGRWIEDTKLDFDPAIAFCIACWGQMQTEH